MNDYNKIPQPIEYGNIDCLPEDWKEFLEENHAKLTCKQLCCIRDFCQKKADSLKQNMEEHVSIEDFENAKKRDGDGDGESTSMEEEEEPLELSKEEDEEED